MTKEETIVYKNEIVTYPEMNFAKKLFNFLNPFNTPLGYTYVIAGFIFVKLGAYIGTGIALGSIFAGAPLLPQTISYAISNMGFLNNFLVRSAASLLTSRVTGHMIGLVFDSIMDSVNYGTNIFRLIQDSSNESLTEVRINRYYPKLGGLIGCATAIGGLMVGVPLIAPTISNAITYLGFLPITSYFGRAVASTAACTAIGNTVGKAVEAVKSCTNPDTDLDEYWRFRAYTLKDVKIVRK